MYLCPTTAIITFSVSESFSEIIVVTMASFHGFVPLVLPLILCYIVLNVNSAEGVTAGSLYRGKYIGRITAQKHKVSGEVYAVDSRTLHIRGFTYDGTGPDAFFWIGFTEHPSPQGIIVPNDRGTKEVLGAYNSQDITISLPDGLTLRDIKWLAVWCRAYEVNFGDLYIPANLDYPQPHVVGSLVGQHGVSSGPVVVVDAQTILVPDFTYDGQAPDLHFWVGRGTPGPQGIRVPDETGGDSPLQKADKKTMVLSLPGDLTVFDIDYFGVWCRLYSIDFGHVRITPGLNVPPSLRMLGVAPQHVAVAHPNVAVYSHNTAQPIQPVQYIHQSPAQVIQPAVQTIIQPAQTVTQIPQQQYYEVIDNKPQTVQFTTDAAQTIYHEPQTNVVTYQANAPIQTGVVYSAPLTSATTTILNPQQHTLGSNGYSTYTIRTSKGSATSDVLY